MNLYENHYEPFFLPSPMKHCEPSPRFTNHQVGQDDLALQLLWLLQALAAEAPTERWADTMRLGRRGGRMELVDRGPLQDGAPRCDVCWFINHEIIPINYSYIYHKPLLSHL
jgi:hypothetical protein